MRCVGELPRLAIGLATLVVACGESGRSRVADASGPGLDGATPEVAPADDGPGRDEAPGDGGSDRADGGSDRAEVEDAAADSPDAAAAGCSKLWVQALAQGGDEGADRVAVAGDGDVVVVGYSGPTAGQGARQIWIRRYDGAGIERWVRSFDAGENAEARALTVDRLGNAIAVGVGGGRSWVRKLDRAGGTVFHALGAAGSGADAVATDDAGNVFVATPGLGVRKYDAQGAEGWSTPAPAVRTTFPGSIAVDGKGEVVVAGTVLVGDGGPFGGENSAEDIWVRKYDAAGVTRWTQTFDGGRADRAIGVVSNAGGEVFVTGTTFGELARPQGPRFGWRRWLRKHGEQGAPIFTAIEDSAGPLPVVLPDGGVLLVGWLETAVFAADGTPGSRRACSAEATAGTASVALGGLAFDPAGFVILVGRVPDARDVGGFAFPFDAWIGKYAAP